MVDKFPKASIIISSFDGYRGGNVPKLLEDIKEQDFKDVEIIIIKGISPLSRARNEGAKKAKGNYLIFMDDDIRLANKNTISSLIQTFGEDPKICIVGAARLIPEDASFFQRRTVKECSFAYLQMADKTTDLPMVSHVCQAVPKELYLETDGQHEGLFRGEDVEFTNRIGEAGYRTVLAANAGTYHPPDENLLVLIKKRFKSGFLGAFDQVYYPHLIYEYGRGGEKNFKKQYSLPFRVIRFIFDRLLFSLISLRFIRFIFYTSFGIGRAIGILIFGFKKYFLGNI